uniref:Annexin n=1 Tax=Canis lupus familiaris TaxID=9615 RepID=A0A8P0P5I2_CANLF
MEHSGQGTQGGPAPDREQSSPSLGAGPPLGGRVPPPHPGRRGCRNWGQELGHGACVPPAAQGLHLTPGFEADKDGGVGLGQPGLAGAPLLLAGLLSSFPREAPVETDTRPASSVGPVGPKAGTGFSCPQNSPAHALAEAAHSRPGRCSEVLGGAGDGWGGAGWEGRAGLGGAAAARLPPPPQSVAWASPADSGERESHPQLRIPGDTRSIGRQQDGLVESLETESAPVPGRPHVGKRPRCGRSPAVTGRAESPFQGNAPVWTGPRRPRAQADPPLLVLGAPGTHSPPQTLGLCFRSCTSCPPKLRAGERLRLLGAAGHKAPPAQRQLRMEQEGVTVKGSPHFNPEPDAEALYTAMKGIGTNEQAIIDVLTRRSNAQRQQIARSFKAQFGKDLTETLQSELSGKFERLMVALMYPPYRYEAKELHEAMKGLGTKEGVIIEILASRTKNHLREIMKAYEADYGSSLEEDIQADTSGYLERILVCLLQGSRDDVSGFVDPGQAVQDAQDLYAAGEKIHGTDEMKFITILCTRSATHLLRVFEEYERIAGKSIEDSIKSETHGSLEEAMLTVVKCTRNLHSYFAERLYYALKGAGTRDGTLIRNIVSRSEIDLNLIKCQFTKMYGKTLGSMIEV